jgi:uncharacterized membrane protein
MTSQPSITQRRWWRTKAAIRPNTFVGWTVVSLVVLALMRNLANRLEPLGIRFGENSSGCE